MNASLRSLLLLLGLACALPAAGHEAHSDAVPRTISTERYAWGREGDPAKATRTVAIDMSDALRFTPARVEVRRGETVRFVAANSGKLMHEMVIGTEEELRRHAEMMKKFPGMKHSEPYMAHVSPGEQGSIAWTFTEPGTFMFGCLVPGHWDGGMKGTIVVKAR
jgi:uncharacterized cupredoxin-like copper-binding protein